MTSVSLGGSLEAFAHDRASISLHRPVVNLLGSSVRQLENDPRSSLLLALPHSRSEVVFLHCNPYERVSPVSLPQFRLMAHHIKLPELSQVRALSWLPDCPNLLAIATQDRIWIYTVNILQSISAGIDCPRLVHEVELPQLPAQLLALRGGDGDGDLHLLALTAAQTVLYVHLRQRPGGFSTHIHPILDHIRFLQACPNGRGVHILDKHQRHAFYSTNYIRSRLSTSSHAAHKVSVQSLDGSSLVPVGMLAFDDAVLLSFAPLDAPLVSQGGSTGAGFKHVLVGTSLADALHVPVAADAPDAGSALDGLLHIAARAEAITGLHSPLRHTASTDGRTLIQDLQTSPAIARLGDGSLCAADACTPSAQLFAALLPADCEHFTSLAAPSSLLASTPLDMTGDVLAVYSLGGEDGKHLVAVGSSSGSQVQVFRRRAAVLDLLLSLPLAPQAACRGLRFVRSGQALDLLVVQVAKAKASEPLPTPISLSTAKELRYELLLCPLVLTGPTPSPPAAPSTSSDAPVALGSPITAPPSAPAVSAGLEAVLLQALGGLQNLMTERFGQVDRLLSAQQATIDRLQAEVNGLRGSAVDQAEHAHSSACCAV